MIRDKELKRLREQIKTINETNELKSLYTESTNKEMKALYDVLNNFVDAQYKKMIADKKMKESYQQMLSNISHDLKTPLTVMQGMTELINFEEKTVTENQRLLDKIEEKIFEVQKMMQNFFDLNKIEAEDVMMEFKQLDIVELTKKILLQYYDTLQEMGIELFLEFSDEKILLVADEISLKRIINNLISNAIKYGHDGKIVGCKIIQKPTKVELTVWDKGKGIEEQFYNQIFERLFTLEDSRNKDYSGSGIGLTITKRLIEKHQGTIRVFSEPFDLTKFEVTFPLK